MYLNMTVPMPSEKAKLTTKTISKTPYVYYEIGRTYDKEKRRLFQTKRMGRRAAAVCRLEHTS